MAWLEELLQLRWPELKVHVTSVSDQWAGVSVAGPNSRDAIAACLEDPKTVSAESLPFMGVQETRLKSGIRCLIARISFSGELAYELYAPANHGEAMMDLLWAASEPLGGCLYGLEALGTLRIEKGHVTGAELDGRVTIDDAGLGKMALYQETLHWQCPATAPRTSARRSATIGWNFPQGSQPKLQWRCPALQAWGNLGLWGGLDYGGDPFSCIGSLDRPGVHLWWPWWLAGQISDRN